MKVPKLPAIIIGLLALIAAGYWLVGVETPKKPDNPAIISAAPVAFSGTLESVDTGCFADGECFIVVDGKHVNLLWGWNREVVGEVRGADGIGGLESHIGKTIKVYAQPLIEGGFTLYGSADYYVSL